MKVSWIFLLVVFVLSSWVDGHFRMPDFMPTTGSLHNDGFASVGDPAVPVSGDGSVSVDGPSVPSSGDGSLSAEGFPIPSSGDATVSAEGFPVPSSGDGFLSAEGFPIPSSGDGSVSAEGSSVPSGSVSFNADAILDKGICDDFLFDEFNESKAFDSFTGLPVFKDFKFGPPDESMILTLNDDYAAAAEVPSRPTMVGLTLVQGAAEKGALCLDGSLPAYHYDKGFESGKNSWLINLEGGGWCNSIKTCAFRSNSKHGSSNQMEKAIPFTGILSNKAKENPVFYNWNRVRVRYCDGASFKGDGENRNPKLFFRGQRIWAATMQELMSLGMSNATQALLSGCSAGGLSTIHHCDEFRALFPKETKVKCLSDAGFFLDTIDVSGGRTLRSLYDNVVKLQGVKKNLPSTCTSSMEPSLCFFPQYFVDNIKTPLFLVNAAYDAWQIQDSLAPRSADPDRHWLNCTLNIAKCNATQLKFLQNFRNETINDLKGFSTSKQNGLFINSCFAHCQTDKQDMWHGDNAPRIGNKTIAEATGDWYYDRQVKFIDCPYPCDKTCHNLVFDRTISV